MSAGVSAVRDLQSLADVRAAVRDLPVVRERGRVALRVGALAGVALLVGSYLSVLYYVVETVGRLHLFAPLIVAAVALAVVLGSVLTRRQALWVSAVLLAAGLAAYVATMPPSFLAMWSIDRFVGDLLAMLTGYSILRLTNAGTWALAVLPGPTFLTVYFAVRNEYVRAVTIGGLTLVFFVLTGDSGTIGTLLGVVGAAGAVGFHTLASRGGTRGQVEVLAIALAAMILATAAVSAVPGGGQPLATPGPTYSVEGQLVSADERTRVTGSIRLSPEVRFVVDADRASKWRVGVYDRFTGSGWIRTGGTEPLDGPVAGPPGPWRRNLQQVSPRQHLDVMPAAAEPVEVNGADAVLSEHGAVHPGRTLVPREEYTVISRQPVRNVTRFRRAGTDYPDGLAARYTQLPSKLPDRVAQLADSVTANASTPYAKARVVEGWLEANKNYSLSIDRPSGNVVDGFLFERDAGYCVYFASSMVTMLRTQDVPARYVVGYTPGQRVDEDTWVVRGYDAHAWVEVYLPDVGWVAFDPTPADPRESAERARLEEAREQGAEGVEAEGSAEGTYTPTPTTRTPVPDPEENDTREPTPVTPSLGDNETDGNVTVPDVTLDFEPGDGDSGAGGFLGTDRSLPPPETAALWGLLAVGLVAGLRRTGAAERLYRAAWLRWQPRGRGDPADQVERAYRRVEYLLARRHRPRRSGETVREYLAATGAEETAREVARLREQVRYAGSTDEATAAAARSLAADYVQSRAGVATVFNRLLS